jgi:two-component system sensor histidine kinase/response regulator
MSIKNGGESTSVFFIENVLNEVVESNLQNAQKKDLSLSYAIEGNPKISAEKNQTMFIIRNLVGNAIKFTPSGGFIKIHCNQTSYKKIKIAVTDNGVGMSKVIKNTIFNDNKKASSAGTNGEKGHCIGLLLVKEFVIKNNGELEIFSEDNAGTTFLLTMNSGD